MKIKFIVNLCFMLLLLFYSNIGFSRDFSISPLPPLVRNKIIGSTWFPHCPLSLSALSYLHLRYWGFDKQSHEGVLIINHRLAQQVLTIFKQLYHHHFPIQSMRLIDNYKGKVRKHLDAINTIGFNCRRIVGGSKRYSLHSYGIAIDINPLQNPYISAKKIIPAGGWQYRNRQEIKPGMILKNGLVYKLFKQAGWQWGGNWRRIKDYMHFEKK